MGLDFDSLQIVDSTADFKMSTDYRLTINQEILSRASCAQQCHFIDHELYHWSQRHTLERYAIICNLSMSKAEQLKRQKKWLVWIYCQEKQADILTGLGDLKLARAGQDLFHNVVRDKYSNYNLGQTDFEGVFSANEQLYVAWDSKGYFNTRTKGFKAHLQDHCETDGHPAPSVRWYYFKKLGDRMQAEQDASSSND